MSIITPDEYKASNPRIDGIKLLSLVKKSLSRDMVNIVDVRVITQETFLHYLKHKKFSIKDLEAIKKEAKELLSTSDTGLLAVRRAYHVPGLENPPGPRYLGIKTPDEALKAVKDVFDFAIEHDYHKTKGFLVESFMYPFIDPPQIDIPVKNDTVFPRGGYGVPNDNHLRTIRILAVFGNNEGFQSLSGVDEYVVDVHDLVITNKIIPQKEYALCTTTRAQDDKVRLPLRHQFSQVLNDLEILEAAMVVAKCSKLKNKPQRVEFSSNGETLFYNEVLDYRIENVEWDEMVLEGEVVTIDGPDQISFIGKNDQNIIYISKKVVEKRDYDTLNTIASVKDSLIILYPGTSATAHAMRVLVDAGHKAFVVGNQEFRDKDIVSIIVGKDGVTIEKTGKELEHESIIPLEDALMHTIEDVGGKAHKLGHLISLGYKVPKGFVLDSSLEDDEEFLESDKFKNFISTLDKETRYAVRSSANVEDGEKNAFAGQFETITMVSRDGISEAVKKVWLSAKNGSLDHLLNDLDLPKIKMAVIIQEMIDPHFSGVIFGANIETKDTKQVVLELTKGYAEGVVDGTAQVRKVVFDKTTRQIIEDIDTNDTDINIDDLTAVFEMYMRLEDNFDTPQDVEWTIDTNNDLYILQTRDLRV